MYLQYVKNISIFVKYEYNNEYVTNQSVWRGVSKGYVQFRSNAIKIEVLVYRNSRRI